jgi:F-type H+-transporting ATPase subunit b
MLINWFTVVAQMINFLVLVWLLKRFLYKPILDGIAAREKGIADQLSSAASTRADAQKEHDEFDSKNKIFDQERSALMQKADEDSKAERDRLMKAASKDAEDARSAQIAVLKAERARLGDRLMRMAKDEVFDVARKTLSDLANASLEQQMEKVFVERLRGLQGDARDSMRAALTAQPGTAVIRSAFELPGAEKESIQNAVNESFSASIALRFEVSTNLSCGIELTGDGQKVEWNITEYLDAFHEKIGALMDAQATSTSTTAQDPVAEDGPDAHTGKPSNDLVATGTH